MTRGALLQRRVASVKAVSNVSPTATRQSDGRSGLPPAGTPLQIDDGDDPVIGVRRQYVSTQISTTAFTNQAGVRSSQTDALWDQAIRSTGSQYTSLYHQIQQLAVQTLPYVWITETVNTRVSRSVCHNFNQQNTGLFMETAWCTG